MNSFHFLICLGCRPFRFLISPMVYLPMNSREKIKRKRKLEVQNRRKMKGERSKKRKERNVLFKTKILRQAGSRHTDG